MFVDVGLNAPDFTLANQDRQPVTLSAARGRPVVLVFFPAAFRSVCTQELCTFRDALNGLDKLGKLNWANVQVYGISVDTFFALKRAVFVIDKEGIVRHREVLDDARNEPNYQEVHEALASLLPG